MNAIEILNEQLAGKSLVMYVAEVNGEVIEELNSFTEFKYKGCEVVKRHFVINSVEYPTTNDNAYKNSDFIIVLENGNRIPVFSFTYFETIQE